MTGYEHIEHTFAPVYDADSLVLILGTLPSVKSRENHFYYGHKQNRTVKIKTVSRPSGANWQLYILSVRVSHNAPFKRTVKVPSSRAETAANDSQSGEICHSSCHAVSGNISVSPSFLTEGSQSYRF